MKLQQTLVLICATIYSFAGNVNGQLTNSTTDAAVNPFLSIFHYLSPASWMPVANNVVPAVAVNHIPDCSPTDQQTPENSDQNRVKPQDHHKAIHSQKGKIRI
jgi:hypothetical protein